VIADRKARARERWRGLENLLVPSFDADLRRLDEEGVRLDVRQSVAQGLFSTCCALDAGLAADEKRRLVELAVDEAAGRIAVSIAPGAAPVDEVLALVRHAEAVGASHVHLAYPQDFAPRSADELVDYVRRVADASALSVCLTATDRTAFHALHPSGVPLAAFERLAEHDAVVALQLGSQDSGLILEACERLGGRLLVGSPHLGWLPMLAAEFGVQWSGPWNVEAVQSPARPLATEMLSHLAAGDLAAAMRCYWAMAPAFGAWSRAAQSFAHTGAQHWPLLKYQQWLGGGNGGMTRQPVMRLFQRDMQAIRAGLAAAGVECGDADAEFFRGRSARRHG
jgi:4-hydroxy-tetrahydrodipicolinate synthase